MTLSSTNFQQVRQTRDLRKITQIVSEHYGYAAEVFLTGGRAEPLVTYRQIAMFLCRELTRASLPDIAEAFQKKNHKTVMHACSSVPAKAAQNQNMRETLAFLRKACSSAIAPAKTI